MSRQVAEILRKSGLLAEPEIAAASARAEELARPLWEVVLSEHNITEEQLAQAFATHLRIYLVKLAATPADPDAIKLVSETLARKHLCVPLRVESDARHGDAGGSGRRAGLVLAMANPTDLAALQDVEFATGCQVKPVVATHGDIRDALARYYAPETYLDDLLRNATENTDELVLTGDEEEELDEVQEDSRKQGPAVKMVNLILLRGLRELVSDIHIEAGHDDATVRMRKEGLLRDCMKMPNWLQPAVVSRLKVLAKLDISERRRPQDGRIKVKYEQREMDLRVSTLPTHFGEKVVLRILGSGQQVPSPSSLGLKPEDLEVLKQAADQPQGLILVTGPTGSGKTTTLYSLLNEKLNPTINIITVEDPIEFQLAGINQVQVNHKAGLTFASTLRSILRQDPDVILIGEIRDLETAEIAFHAAMTGHLVLSTLHTNSTVATITRLLDLGVDPVLIASSLNLVVAQRLVRKICENCREEYQPTARQLERFHLEDSVWKFQHGRGCDTCGGTGYSGRQGIYELLRITPTLKELITHKAPEPELRRAAHNVGTSLLLDGALELVRTGTTTLDELLRVVQTEEDEARRCPKCSALVTAEFSTCPSCLHVLKCVCHSCKQELKPDWKICPFCNTPVQKPADPRIVQHASLSDSPLDAGVAAQLTASHTAGNGQTARKNPRIVVVDDDPAMRQMVVRSLQRLPMAPEVFEAPDGESGLAIVMQTEPDLVVLDVKMPGMSGFDVCQAMRSQVQTAFTPVLMLTAETDEASRTKGFLGGSDDYMNKPISIPELNARVGRLLRRN
ncbi:MAG: Flp pilus assembly complex ATPase component TadA [Acidobacteria bacterium]|nr:Flp pilus assembly complex ATPase component TadA [Acidobacteriota bacterium]